MHSRSKFAFAAALIVAAAVADSANAVPLPRDRHVPTQYRPLPPSRPHEAVGTGSLRPVRGPSPLSQTSLSARTGDAVPALVAEARKYMGTNPTDRKRLWCATFMNFVLAKLGYSGTNSDAARSFAYYGRRISEPRVGAIAVLTRGRRGGHVGVVSGIDKSGDPIIISGNHNKLVGEGVYPRSRVIAYVMPTEHRSAMRLAANGPVSLPKADAGLDSPITELIAAIEAEQGHAENSPERRKSRSPGAAPRQAPPPVPHRTVQQLPEASPQPTNRRRAAGGNRFSALLAEIEQGSASSSRR